MMCIYGSEVGGIGIHVEGHVGDEHLWPDTVVCFADRDAGTVKVIQAFDLLAGMALGVTDFAPVPAIRVVVAETLLAPGNAMMHGAIALLPIMAVGSV